MKLPEEVQIGVYFVHQQLPFGFQLCKVQFILDEIFVGGFEVFDKLSFVALAVVDITTQFFEAHLFQAMINDIEGGPFLADKENILSPGDKISNEVGNGLTLAGAGRTLDNITITGPALQNSPCLCRVCRNHMIPVIGSVQVECMRWKTSRLLAEQRIKNMMLELRF